MIGNWCSGTISTCRRGRDAGFGAIVVLLLFQSGQVMAGTTTTSYYYNGDGAPTAIEVQQDGGTAVTTYLTWDNFIPDTTDPSTGMLSAANGRLLAIGDIPGGTPQFSFDVRDRLLSAQSANADSVSYAYHAGGLLASLASDTSKVSFYFGSGKYPRITNQVDASTGSASAMLSPVRYVSDGTEQLLLIPRKDVLAVYTPSDDALGGYNLQPYGAAADGSGINTGNLSNNPFRFAAEYRDPSWSGYYLRGRWYHPDLPSFISRDPRPGLNRFGYGGGNPLMHLDPSGFGFFHALGDLVRDIEHGAAKLNIALNKGWWGNFDRFFLAPIMGPLQVLADPKAFWQSIRTDKDGIDIFMVLGAASGEGFELLTELHPTESVSIFWARIGASAHLSLASAVATGADRGFKHFSWIDFRNALEGGFGNIFDYNVVAGRGYNRFNLGGKELADGMELLQDQPEGSAFIFRRAVSTRSAFGEELPVQTSPIQEWLHLGRYQEQVVAVTRDGLYLTELTESGAHMALLRADPQTLRPMLENLNHGGFELVGHIDNFDPDPAEIEAISSRIDAERAAARVRDPRTWHGFGNASQRHAAAVLRTLGMR